MRSTNEYQIDFYKAKRIQYKSLSISINIESTRHHFYNSYLLGFSSIIKITLVYITPNCMHY